MNIKKSSLEEATPLLKVLWPDSSNISQFDNSLGLVSWSPSELYKAKPVFYAIEENGDILASLHAYLASDELVCIRGLVFWSTVQIPLIRKMIDLAVSDVKLHTSKRIYMLHKDTINTIIPELGMSETTGPLWTNQWKIYISWLTL